jgi:hypothetical protein
MPIKELLMGKAEEKKSLSLQIDELYKKLYAIDEEIAELKKTYMLENSLLCEGVWEIRIDTEKLTLYSTNKVFKKLSDTLQSDHHQKIRINDFTNLHFDDWDIYLDFSDIPKAKEFIKRYGIKLNDKKIRAEIKDLNKTIQDLQNVLNKID